MTVILEMEPRTEKRSKSDARPKGVSPNQFVQSILEEKLSNGKDKDQTMTGILREMLAEGIICRIPEGITSEEDDFEPIKINGKSFSETILEDRDSC
ncbi:MAG: hypothetical protein ABIP78_05315 [Pyrinomonadaceae bacterium]